MLQLIICQYCPYFLAKCKDGSIYCDKSEERCVELEQYKNYKKELDDYTRRYECL